jgi:branched-chain amino acid transport system permease protein
MAGVLPWRVPENSALHRGMRLLRVAVAVIVLLSLPYTVASFRLGEITGALIIATAAVGLNLLTGFGGQISLGHAAFFGIGAYTTGILITRYHTSAPLAFVAGMALCFVVGVLVGVPALRLQGMYLALVTLAVGVIFPSLVRRFESITGGSAGLFGVKYPAPSGAYFAGRAGQVLWLYWVSVVALGLAALIVWNLMRGRMGRAIVALRDNESAAIVMGVNRTVVRTVMFGISAAIAGLAGGLFAVDTGILTPDSFSLLFTINLLVAIVLGGRASFWGPVLGGFAVYYLPLWTANYSGGPIAGVIFGVIVILMVFTFRDGLVGAISRLASYVVVIQPQPPKVSTDIAEHRLLPEVDIGAPEIDGHLHPEDVDFSPSAVPTRTL